MSEAFERVALAVERDHADKSVATRRKFVGSTAAMLGSMVLIMGVEGVHRALARQSLGLLGNDRVFMKEETKETAPGAPNRGQPGFEYILDAVAQLEAAGFGFGSRPPTTRT